MNLFYTICDVITSLRSPLRINAIHSCNIYSTCQLLIQKTLYLLCAQRTHACIGHRTRIPPQRHKTIVYMYVCTYERTFAWVGATRCCSRARAQTRSGRSQRCSPPRSPWNFRWLYTHSRLHTRLRFRTQLQQQRQQLHWILCTERCSTTRRRRVCACFRESAHTISWRRTAPSASHRYRLKYANVGRSVGL